MNPGNPPRPPDLSVSIRQTPPPFLVHATELCEPAVHIQRGRVPPQGHQAAD